MAMPILVWLMSCVRTTTRKMVRKGVMMVTHLVEAPPMETLADQARDLGIDLGQTAGDVQRQVLEQIADADGGDHQGHSGCGTQGFIGHLFNGHSPG